MNNNELDEFLKKSFKDDSCDSPFTDEIDNLMNGLYKKRKRRNKFLLAIPILLVSTTAFAVAYNTFNLSSVNIDSSSAIELAVQNGYIQHVDMEMQTFEGVGITIERFLMDDINLDITFKYKVDNNTVNIDDIKDLSIQDIIIYDENNNIIHNSKNYSYENNLSKATGHTKVKKISNETFENTFFAQANNFPNSQKLYIEFETVNLNCKKATKKINGKWKFELDVPENMVNREEVSYKCTSGNNEGNIIVNEVKLTNTGLIVQIGPNSEELLNNIDIEVIANNKKYKANNNLYSDIENINSNKFKRTYSFNLTIYDEPNEIIIIIKNDKENKKIVFTRN